MLKSFFNPDNTLSKIFLGAFVVNWVLFFYYGIMWECTYRNCGGVTGIQFWVVANLAPLLSHFCFWVRNESEELSRFIIFRTFCVGLSMVGHVVLILCVLNLMKKG